MFFVRRLVVLAFVFALLVPNFGFAKNTSENRTSIFSLRNLTCGLVILAVGIAAHDLWPARAKAPAVVANATTRLDKATLEANVTMIEPYRLVDKDSVSNAAANPKAFQVQLEDGFVLLPYSPFSFPEEKVLRFAGKSAVEIREMLQGEDLPLLVVKFDPADPNMESKRRAIYLHEYMKMLLKKAELTTRVMIKGEEVNPLEYAASQNVELQERYQTQIEKAEQTGKPEDLAEAFLTAAEYSYFEVYRLYLDTRNSLEVALVQLRLAKELGLTEPASEIIVSRLHDQMDSLNDRIRDIGNIEKLLYLDERQSSLTKEQFHAIWNYDLLLQRVFQLQKVAREVLPKVEPPPLRIFIIPLGPPAPPQPPEEKPAANENPKVANRRHMMTRSVA